MAGVTAPSNSFDYTVTLGAGSGPFAVRIAAPAPVDARLVGHAPTLTIGAGRPLDHRMPKGVDLGALRVAEVMFVANQRLHATLERASFEIPEALAARFAPGDELLLLRPGLADLALWLVRDGRLLFAAGALAGERAGLRVAAGAAGQLDATIDGATATLGVEPAEVAGYLVFAPGPPPRSPLGRGACVAAVRRGFADLDVAVAAALLLHHGPFRMLPWVRRGRGAAD